MGKYQVLFRNVALGISACETDEVCPRCPYLAFGNDKCKLMLEADKHKIIKIMTYLDKMDKDVEEIDPNDSTPKRESGGIR